MVRFVFLFKYITGEYFYNLIKSIFIYLFYDIWRDLVTYFCRHTYVWYLKGGTLDKHISILVALLFETEFHPPPPQVDFIVTLYTSNSLIAWSSCVQIHSVEMTFVYQHGWHGTHQHVIPEGAACVCTCAWEWRGQRSMLCRVEVFSHPQPFSMSQSFLLNLQVTVLGGLIGQQESGIHLSSPLHHWVMGT